MSIAIGTGANDFGSDLLPAPLVLRTERSRSDRAYRIVASGAGFGTFAVLFLIGLFLLIYSVPALHSQGFGFLTHESWVTSGAHPVFGIGAELYGTVIIAVVALVVALPVSLAASLCISQYAPGRVLRFIPLQRLLITLVDLMAAVPSVIFGLWGFFVLQPRSADIAQWLSAHLGWIPIFKVQSAIFTSSYFIVGIVVGIMIMPTVTSLSREVYSLTPKGEMEGAFALGASRASVIRRVVMPFGKGGLIGATMLAFGRALGETVAVAIILSLTYTISPHILQGGGGSITALIVNDFGTGGKRLGLSGLLAAGLVLFVVTLLVNVVASWIVTRTAARRAS